MNRRAFLLSGAGALGAALWGGCVKTAAKRPNIVAIVLDTVRADHTGPGGYARRTTPCLDAFVREASWYSRVLATAPWTLPSHATLFTGQYSFQHGVEGVLNKDAQGAGTIIDPPLPDASITLAELLSSHGYATAAFTANTAYMSVPFNLGQGFGVYEVDRVPGVDLLERIGRWVDANRRGPFFLFVNFMDAHLHYNTAPCPGAFDEPVSQDTELILRFIEDVMPGEHPADPKLVEEVTKQYDMGIANADFAAGRLFERLKHAGVYDESLVVLLSDHGEYLGEHQLVQHSKDLHQEVLHVPMAIKAPRQRQAARRDTPASLAQFCSAMLDVARVPENERPRPMAPSWTDPAPLLAEINYSRNWDFQSPVWGKRFHRLRTAYCEYPWKLIRSSDGRHDLFHLEEDPKESDNRFEKDPDRAAALLAALEKIKPAARADVSTPPGGAPELNNENLDALKANGYL